MVKNGMTLMLITFAMSMGAGHVFAATQSDTIDEYIATHGDRVYVCDEKKKHHRKNRSKLVSQEKAREIIEDGGYLGPCVEYGDKQSMGDGYFQTYTQILPDGSVWGMGFQFPESTLNNLPQEQYDGLNCFDSNGNGQFDYNGNVGGGDLDHSDECAGGHERSMALPNTDVVAPFKWGLVNWQAHGHTPLGVYDLGHFDFHFYTQELLERNFIRVGPCALLVNCDDFVKGIKPLPEGHMPQDYFNVGAVESRMGNHLVDLTTGEWTGEVFTETWIYGAYDGELTFWEPMITLTYLQSKPFMCKTLKLPQKYAEAGYYPTEYCVRYRAEREDFTVSLEGFVYRDAN